MAKKKQRAFGLHCGKCNRANYRIFRSTRKEKLDGIKKYCRGCQAHTSHIQKKIPKPQ